MEASFKVLLEIRPFVGRVLASSYLHVVKSAKLSRHGSVYVVAMQLVLEG
jgi:hypothetical protein